MSKTYGGWSKFQPFIKEDTLAISFQIQSDNHDLEEIYAYIKKRIWCPFRISLCICRLTETGLKKEKICTYHINEESYYDDIESVCKEFNTGDILLGWSCADEKKILKAIGVTKEVIDLEKHAKYFQKFYPLNYGMQDVVQVAYGSTY